MENHTNSLRAYESCLQKAIEFIEESLSEELSPQIVAARVGYSAFHFHRIFRGMMGESIKDYIRRRRLARAAAMLIDSCEPIAEIACEAGFETQESFTRAFKRMYSTTPGKFRKEGRRVPHMEKTTFSLELVSHIREGLTMQPTFTTREAEHAVGIAGSFKEDSFEEIAELWRRFDIVAPAICDTKEGYSLGLCLESHPDVELKEGDSFIYVAALPVARVAELPKDMVSVEIPSSRYAVFTHTGPINKITHTVNYIWGTWVPKNTQICKKGPDFELYDDRFDPVKLTGEVDIYLPVVD